MIELQAVWGWEPALYLFLGGLGAGTFVTSGIIYLVTKRYRRSLALCMWIAVACLCVGLGLLLMEVSRPLAALVMWRSFSNVGSSWMAIGAWLLFAAVMVFAVCAIFLTDKISGKLPVEQRRRWVNVLAVFGIILGLGVAAYTGILLKSAPGVPFWNSWLLPALFTVSALDTGVALVAVVLAAREREAVAVRRGLEIATVCLVLVESCVLVVFLRYMLAGGSAVEAAFNAGYAQTAILSAQAVTSGQLSVVFWLLVVVCGLALPFLVAIVQLVRGAQSGAGKQKAGIALAFVGPAGALVGGCALRFVVLLAGAHADIVVSTIATLL